MKNTMKCIAITALVAVIGFAFVGCGEDPGNNNNNGTTGTAPTVTTPSLPNGTVGTAYNQTLSASGDTPITWATESGTLPGGLTLNPTTGLISGTPTTAGTSNFTVKATNAAGSGTKPLSITIASGGGGGSTLTVTDIPAKYNGQYAWFFTESPRYLLGCQSFNTGTRVVTLVKIANGSVTLPVWRATYSSGNFTAVERYYGNDTSSNEDRGLIISSSSTMNIGDIDESSPNYINYDTKSITFNNGSATISYNDGTLNPDTANYIIMSNYTNTGFIAEKNGVTLGTTYQPIQTVIDAIRTDANGAACTIQFGNLTNTLDIGTAGINFSNSDGTWGSITLSGKLTLSGSISIGSLLSNTGSGVSVNSTADITFTGTASSGFSISGESGTNSGTLTISGGTVSKTRDNGGGYTIFIGPTSTGAVTISSGTVKTTGGDAIYHYGTGTVTVNGGTVQANDITSGGTHNGTAIYNRGTGTVNIISGTVSAVGGSAINGSNGTITISGGTISGSGTGSNGSTIIISSSTILNMSSGTVEATANYANAIMVDGTATITGGTIRATGTGSYAVTRSSGTVTITTPPTVIDKTKTSGTITWIP